MYLEIKSELYKKIQSYTATDYFWEYGLVEIGNVISMLEDLVDELENKDEKIKELINDRDENYELKKSNPYDELGINENEF